MNSLNCRRKWIFLMCVAWLVSTSCKTFTPDKTDRSDNEFRQTFQEEVDRTQNKNILKTVGSPAEKAPAVPPEGPIRINIKDAVLLALENNQSLIIERLTPSIRQTVEETEQARFDPSLTGSFGFSRERRKQQIVLSPNLRDNTSSAMESNIGVSKYFSTGTEMKAEISTDRTWSDLYSDFHATRLGVSITQSLLKGLGSDVNLVGLRQARVDTHISEYELRGFAEALIATVERTYWEYALSLREIEIYEESLKVADQYLRETKDIISVGNLAETELIAAQAEIALRRQDLIDAKSEMEIKRLSLLRLVTSPSSNLWQREIVPLIPAAPRAILDDVTDHVKVALRLRPDLNQARLKTKRGELEIVKTKNGLLPRLDAFVTLGKTGYSDSFSSAVGDIFEDDYDALGGVRLQYPFRNRNARAEHRRAQLSYDQALGAVKNLAQLVEVDVRSAYIAVNRSKEQIAATEATRKLQEEKLRIENEKFRVGRSTSLLVAQAWRDLVSSQISEVKSKVDYLRAVIDLYRLEGSLLERRGISAPGNEPVSMPPVK
jgi:outer membrane protein TolC